MAENWVPVLQDNGKYAINGNNIVLQNTQSGEIGYAENSKGNRQLFHVEGREAIDNPQCEIADCDNEVQDERASTSKETEIEWGDETKLLLDLYYEYLPDVGPMKKFRSKKKMWEQISADIGSQLNIIRTAIQCETRFKTMKRRKTLAKHENNISGNNPVKVPYEDEFNKIKSIDDSIEPEILVDVTHKVVNRKESVHKTETSDQNVKKGQKRKSEEIGDVLMSIHNKKEASREQRHKEKMEILKKFFEKRDTCCCKQDKQ